VLKSRRKLTGELVLIRQTHTAHAQAWFGIWVNMFSWIDDQVMHAPRRSQQTRARARDVDGQLKHGTVAAQETVR
jgi:hypothetical protein